MCDVIWYVLRTWAGATAPVPVSWGVYSPEWGRLAREACAHLRRRLVLSEEPGLLRPNWFCPGEWRSSLLCFTVCVLSVIKKKKKIQLVCCCFTTLCRWNKAYLRCPSDPMGHLFVFCALGKEWQLLSLGIGFSVQQHVVGNWGCLIYGFLKVFFSFPSHFLN